ncbi:MAG: RidA family protein [Coriobacteriales bacterium]|jgi:2-iminobutanoate/2-iminopropanoate deaminase|nr:RidA family protein [Coriobacteriales bacterium]
MNRHVISSEELPAAVGPYSHGIRVSDLVFTSGQLPVDPATGEFPQGVEAQARQSLANLKTVLEAGGSGMADVIKTTVFLKDINDFATVNEVYAEAFAGMVFPARSAFAVDALPKGALVEIEAIALVGQQASN